MPLLSVYIGNDPAALASFESWLGRNADGVHGVIGGVDWQDFTSSAQWMVDALWSQIPNRVFWSVPLIVSEGATLEAAAAGDYDGYYLSVARTLAVSRAGDSDPIYIRTGWEFNGDWFPWSAIGKADAYIGAFRHFVDAFRSVSGRFTFEWNVNVAPSGMDPATAYPGDGYVDIVGMDFYYDTRWDSPDPLKAWDDMVNRTYGLAWMENFAAAHGKPTAYSEWGTMTDTAGPYIEKAAAWFDSHDVVYQGYWNSDAANYPGTLSDGSNPDAGTAFRDAFGQPDGTDTLTLPAPEGGAPWTWAWGTAAAEHWSGTDGNDEYTSNGGGDAMLGGAGDDTYDVSSSADHVVEQPGQGIDTIRTWLASYTLPANVENLVLTGTGWCSGTGNALDNRITGNGSPNTLAGGAGDDVLTGGGGADTFVVRAGEGSDVILDCQAGPGAGDVLRLEGFTFQDFAAVLAAATQSGPNLVITLAPGQMLTLANLQVSALAADDVVLARPVDLLAAASAKAPAGAAPTHHFAGTAAAESWTGTDGHDAYTSNGGDTMLGGAGDDTYIVTSSADRVIEQPNEGNDTVETWLASYSLPLYVNNLVLTGTAWSSGTGNPLNNRITGNDSPNTLAGGTGDDVLIGGGGADAFIIRPNEGTDAILDFQTAAMAGSGHDVLRFIGFGAGASLTQDGNAWTASTAAGLSTTVILPKDVVPTTLDCGWG